MLKTIVKKIRCFLTDEEGPTAVEYAVMLMMIVLVCMTAIQALGRNASESFEDSNDKMEAAAAP